MRSLIQDNDFTIIDLGSGTHNRKLENMSGTRVQFQVCTIRDARAHKKKSGDANRRRIDLK